MCAIMRQRCAARSQVIAILRDILQAFYAEMTAGLSGRWRRTTKLLFLTQSGRDGRQRAFDALLAQGVDGIVLAGRHPRGGRA